MTINRPLTHIDCFAGVGGTMKRLTILLTFVLLTMSVVAQQRMNFLGQPLGCSISTFKQRMATKGYKYLVNDANILYSFEGVFGGDKVFISAFVTPKSKIVYRVVVVYRYVSDYSKSTLEYKKKLLVDSFIKKYGYYTREYDEFTRWDFNYGYIAIGCEYYDPNPLTIWYIDKLAEEQYNREQESDY